MNGVEHHTHTCLLPSQKLPSMRSEHYTPGHSTVSRQFMARRSLYAHGAFIKPYLQRHFHVLDCGCGPGSITRDIARLVPQGMVCGIDQSEQQIAEARKRHKASNLNFAIASIYGLPFKDESFDLVFAHALFEHLADPHHALHEIYRILKPEGFVALCSPDFAAFIITPETDSIREAFAFYRNMQEANGGNTLAGRHLPTWLTDFGFALIKTQGRCENYSDPRLIGEYLAHQLDTPAPHHASSFRQWMHTPGACFAQMWISCIGRKMP